jgi:hypothetical protein
MCELDPDAFKYENSTNYNKEPGKSGRPAQ